MELTNFNVYRHDKTGLPCIFIYVEGRYSFALIDTGATHSLSGVKLNGSYTLNSVKTYYGDTTVRVYKEVNTSIGVIKNVVKGNRKKFPFNTGIDFVIGTETLSQLKGILDMNKNTLSLCLLSQ